MKLIVIEVSDSEMKHLENQMDEAAIATHTDLFREGVKLFQWAVRERKAGRVIASVDEDRKQYNKFSILSGIPST
jgi:hypothetical protein